MENRQEFAVGQTLFIMNRRIEEKLSAMRPGSDAGQKPAPALKIDFRREGRKTVVIGGRSGYNKKVVSLGEGCGAFRIRTLKTGWE